jgi:peptide deformylase
LINPDILERTGSQEYQEGCLSVPQVFEKIERFEKIKVKSLDQDGKCFEFEADGLLSVCIQHEIDHLDGKVFVDYLSALKRNRIKSKLIKVQKKKLKKNE